MAKEEISRKQNTGKRKPKYSKNSSNRGGKSSAKTRFTDEKSNSSASKSGSPIKAYPITDKLSPMNDFSWYNRNPNLTYAVGNIPFPYRPGMLLPLTDLTSGSTLNSLSWPRIPGVMRLEWAPTIGQSATVTDPASIAAKEIFGKVREVFSGSLDADPPDFLIYLLALDSIFSYIGSLKRIFRVLTTYSPDNRTVPDVLLAGLGITKLAKISELKVDKMRLFQVINELVGMTKKFRCPAVFDVFNRHYWMNDNVYTDAPMANSQLYVFQQMAYYKYTMLNTPDNVSAGGLRWYSPNYAPAGSLIDELYAFGVSLIDALASSDDAYIISGYLTRAYADYPVFEVSEVQLDEVLVPVYVPEVLMQIKNSRVVDETVVTITGSDISQDPKTNTLLSAPCAANTNPNWSMRPSITLPLEAPSVELIIESTRLQAFIEPGSLSISSGTEIPLAWKVLAGMVDYGTDYNVLSINQLTTLLHTSPYTTFYSTIQVLSYITQFANAPILAITTVASSGTSASTALITDISNITTFSKEQLSEMHKVCLYSEFNSFGMQ